MQRKHIHTTYALGKGKSECNVKKHPSNPTQLLLTGLAPPIISMEEPYPDCYSFTTTTYILVNVRPIPPRAPARLLRTLRDDASPAAVG